VEFLPLYSNLKPAIMKFNFKSITEFYEHFKDEVTCYKFLENQKWEDGIACPHCGSMKCLG
jgi:hypothetical protein